VCAELKLRGVVVLLAVATGASAGAAVLDVTVPDHAVTVGDRVAVRVTARGEAGILWGELAVATTADGPWAVVDGPRGIRGSDPPAWEVTLAALNVGELALPELVVSARREGGEAFQVGPDSPPQVTVATVLAPEDDGQPAPLVDPVGVTGVPWEWLPPLLVVVLPVVLLVLWWRRRRARAGEPASAPQLPPFEELQRLARVLADRVGRDPAEGLCDQLAAGLRRYLERRSGEPALEMTSYELRGLCRSREWPDDVQRSVQQVMAVADGIRYARTRVTDGVLNEAVQRSVAVGKGLEAHLVERAVVVEGGGS
jgi:hypothetical protein